MNEIEHECKFAVAIDNLVYEFERTEMRNKVATSTDDLCVDKILNCILTHSPMFRALNDKAKLLEVQMKTEINPLNYLVRTFSILGYLMCRDENKFREFIKVVSNDCCDQVE